MKNSNQINSGEDILHNAIEHLNNVVEMSNKHLDEAIQKSKKGLDISSKQFDEAVNQYIERSHKSSKLKRRLIMIILSCSLISCIALISSNLIFMH